ncbi:carbohydrate sulfotransferase 15-like isoform X2 [Branchiostoma floridae x Branchiostoma belcheri]
MLMVCLQPTDHNFLGKLLLFFACILALFWLYGYDFGDLNIKSSWSVGGHNTSLSGERTQLTPLGFNMTRELRRLNPKIFSALPREFLPNYKNPCWFDKSVESTSDKGNKTGDFLLRCLPYVYIIGQPKCGTTDLYSRLIKHPDVVRGHGKEPHWWTRGRFKRQVEGSASTMWDNRHWRREFWDTPNNEPPILVANLIRAVQPKARIIISLRNPTERLYSEYLYFRNGKTNKSVTNFHTRVTSAIMNFKNCLRNNSVRSCVYQPELPEKINARLRLGLYEVYLRDWFSIFPRDQILVQRLEDRSKDLKVTIAEVFKFLQLETVSNKAKNATIFGSQKGKSRKPEYVSMGPMLPKTRQVLDRFYRPYNRRLAELLNNTGFLWVKD